MKKQDESELTVYHKFVAFKKTFLICHSREQYFVVQNKYKNK